MKGKTTLQILIDTSVWIDFFRGRPTPEVAHLKAIIGRQEVVIGDLMLAELLQGIRHDRDLGQVEAKLAVFEIVPLVGESIARQSAVNYGQLRKQGFTIRKTIDCLIATWCISHGVPLLHADRDFWPFVQLGLVDVMGMSGVRH
jgi:predicted nucleic acid-binding protein